MFALLYWVTFVDALLKGVQDSLTPYVTSSFSQHGLLATTSILSTVLGGVCNLTIAKVIDIWGRCESFVAMVLLVAVGMIMKAVCKNVETYAAAEVFYWVGQTGMNYIISVIVADISIHFRTPHTGVGWLVMCQVFNGISSGIWPLTGQLAIMASVGHQEIAVALALFGLFGSVGAAIGLAIAGAIWNNVLPQKLLELLPADTKDQMATIFGDIDVQLSYPIGSPVRDAVEGAYSDVQRKMVIAGAAFAPLCLLCVLIMKNINVRKLEAVQGKQTKGNVF